eukprot:1196177-Prorocentrum_minimum.AAC.5
MRALQPDLSVADLLLNTVALEFIISIDELMFDALAPAKAKQIVASLKPVKVKMLPSWKGLDILMNLEGVVGGRSTGRSACGRAGRNVRRRPRVRGHPRRGTQGPLNTRPCRMRENMRGVRGMRGIQAPPKTIASDESRNFNRASDDRVARLTPPPRWFPSDGSGRMGVSGHRQQQRNQQPQLPGRLPVEPYATDGTNTRRGA